ncbi:MAG TPA: D-2-hydroxyacid dehydrogenase family protein [Acidimicrobiales bacterium]
MTAADAARHPEPVRVAVLDDYQGVALAMGDFASLGDDVVVDAFRDHVSDRDELARLLAGHAVVVAMRERTAIDAELLDRLPDLRLLVTTGMSNAVIDLDAAARNGVTVCGTGGILTPTSEHTWGLILALLRHIPADDAAVRAGGWQTRLGDDLAGRRLGLVGLGRLGALVARVGLAFGMDVVAWSQNLTPERCAEVGVGHVSADELFATADVVSVHVVLSERTRGVIGAPQLARMKSSAVLVNTSRGPIVDEEALVGAVRSGSIAGAALDVFADEPLPGDHPLRSLPNTVLTPHTGYVTRGCYEIFFREIVEDIAAWRAGTPVRVVTAG